MKGPFRPIERLADALLVFLFLLIFVLVLAQVVCRYVFGSPLAWSEELARYAFMWLGMLAWSLGSRRRSHIAITFLAERFPAGARLALEIAVQASIIAFCALLVWHGVDLTQRNLDLPTVTLPISFALVYAIVPVGAAMMILYAAIEIHDLILGRRVGAATRDYVA
ncbi:MAG: TRAP transporter small permease [Alphaproteobacteria bacterium]|nr:TRAP transporter small permease [Alphaproteobacteria bacterium]